MNGQIAHLIGSQTLADRQVMRDVFGQSFQTMGNWRSFLRIALNTDVSAQLGAAAAQWNVGSFHALYIACWIHHPLEKGTFMITLAGLTAPQRAVVHAAYEAHCSSRKSSHLSGAGRSASKGWDFLNGYHELLVQYEQTAGIPHLFLKAEGHTTGISGVVPHMRSWAHKRRHGEGLEASPALHSLAGQNPLVEARAAENYGKAYGKLLKNVLHLGGKQVTVREMMRALIQTTGYPAPANFHMTFNNQQLGQLLTAYCDAATLVGANGIRYRAGGAVTREMIDDLRTVAQSLVSDGAVNVRRVFREIRVTPGDVDQSLATFYATPGV